MTTGIIIIFMSVVSSSHDGVATSRVGYLKPFEGFAGAKVAVRDGECFLDVKAFPQTLFASSEGPTIATHINHRVLLAQDRVQRAHRILYPKLDRDCIRCDERHRGGFTRKAANIRESESPLSGYSVSCRS